jgi:integrase
MLDGTTAGAKRKTKALTAAFCAAPLKPGRYHDGGGTGLFLRVEPNGAKLWSQRVTIQGKRRDLGLGGYPIVGLAQARAKAVENKRAALGGADPLQLKRAAQAIPTFAEAARTVHGLHLPTWKNAKHAAQFITTLETYAFPRMGQMRVDTITSADVMAALAPIWTAKAETAKRVMQRIGTVMGWCVAQGHRTDNPAVEIRRALPKVARTKAHRKALAYQDVAAAIDRVMKSGAFSSTKLCFEWLVLTAARSGEARGATWDEIIQEHGKAVAWEIPAARMKMKRPHRVPLSPRAVEILAEAKAIGDGTGLLFPSLRGKELSDMTLSKLVKELGFEADIHGFRTSFRTWAQEQTDVPREVAEMALAHATGDATEQAYARSDLFGKRAALMEAWSGYLLNERRQVLRISQ